MEYISERLAKFVHELDADSIPEDVRHRAAYLVLDAAGIALASSTYPFAKQAISALASFGVGDCPVIGSKIALPLRDAALANGILVHGLDYDDTHLQGVVHATASCFPAALAAAWGRDRSGLDMLMAYITGIEVAARLGRVVRGELNQIGFHPTGVIAAFACALVAGKLDGLDAEQLVMAQGIVLSMAAGTREYSTEGAATKRMHPGWAAVCGITAARLASTGFTGPRATYEGRFGLYRTHLGADLEKWDMAAATRDLGRVWEINGVAIKPFPACHHNVACLDAALVIANKHRPNTADISNVEVLVSKHAISIVCEPIQDKRRPQNAYAAQFSVPFGVACALIHEKFGLEEIERYRDPEILALAEKVSYREDPATGYPKHFSGEVIVTLKNGERLSHREQINRGAAERPVSDTEIQAKYADNARLALPPDRVEEVCELVLGIERLAHARKLALALA